MPTTGIRDKSKEQHNAGNKRPFLPITTTILLFTIICAVLVFLGIVWLFF